MLKLGIPLAVSLFALPALACDEPRAAGYSYSYAGAAPRAYGYMSYAPAAYYDDDYDGGYYGYGSYYGYGGLGLGVGAGIARRAYWRNRYDNRVNWRGRGYIAPRAAGIGRVGGVGRIGGVGRVGGGRIGRR